jgi:hypothetical protein
MDAGAEYPTQAPGNSTRRGLKRSPGYLQSRIDAEHYGGRVAIEDLCGVQWRRFEFDRDMEILLRRLAVIVAVAALHSLSCASANLGHQQFYSQAAPTKYPPTRQLRVFEYQNVELREIYELLFSDFLIIGRSAFNGPFENPSSSASFAKSIGTDIFISTSQFKETRTSFISLSTPTTSTTHVSGYSGSGSFYGTATTYGTQQTTVPIRVNRYDQDGYYLRNVNNVVPLWERRIEQYERTSQSDLEGTCLSD